MKALRTMFGGRNKIWQGAKIIIIIFLLIELCYISVMEKKISYTRPSDAFIKLRSFDDFAPGQFEDVVYNIDNGGIELMRNELGVLPAGQYTSRELSTDFLIREVVPSWNIYCPVGCGSMVELRVSRDRQSWSPWLYLGRWGSYPRPKNRLTKDSSGEVKADYFVSDAGTSYVQFRVHLLSGKADRSPLLSLFALAMSDQRGDRNLRLRTTPQEKHPVSLWNRQLQVPYRSQGAEDSSISSEICSPTSVSMMMAYWGIDVPTADVAHIAYDPDYKLYGMWWRGVQSAAQFGLSGWVQYFRNWEEVHAWIGKGQPVVACISFTTGKLKGSMTPDSEGHVLIIVGFDDKGNPICNDPAGSSEKDGIVAYEKDEFAAAWFDKGGVGYIIAPGELYP